MDSPFAPESIFMPPRVVWIPHEKA